MSTILKALRRLEQDRVVEAERPLEAAVVEPAPAGPAARGGARWLAGVLAAAALGAGAVLLVQRQAGAPEAFVSAGPPPSARAVAAPPPPVIPSPPVIAAPPRPALASVPAPVEAPPPALAPPAVAAPPPSAAEAVAPALPEEPLDLAEQAQPPPVAVLPPPVGKLPAAVPPVQETPVRVARLEPRATAPKAALPGHAMRGSEAGAVVAQSVTHGADDGSEGEDVRTIEPQRKRTAHVAPATSLDIAVLRTIWHPKSERRTALLDAPGYASPREYREGDRVGSLLLLRIEPSGVVFERDGVELHEKIVARP